jgi:hypothetical protein
MTTTPSTAASAAVVDLETGLPQLDPVMEPRSDEADPLLREDLGADEDPEDTGEAGAVALAVTPDNQFRFLHENGAVGDGDHLWFRIPAPIPAAALSPAADRLAIAVADEIVLVRVSRAPAILARFPAPTE